MKKFLTILGVLLVAILLVPVAIWVLHPWTLPLRWFDPGPTAYMKHRVSQAEAAGEAFEIRHEWTPLDEISPTLIRAVLIAEDDAFRSHRGVDWEALAEEVRYRGAIPPSLWDPEDRAQLRAAWDYARAGRDRVRGRSTITQQLARNLYLSPERSFFRKGRELLLTWKLEAWLSKDRILELYLNVAEFGPGLFGVGAAAEHYFGVPPSQLSAFQSASLAGTLPHPLTSNPGTRPGRMAWRRDLILERMGMGPDPAPVEEPLEEAWDLLPPVDPAAVPDTLLVPGSVLVPDPVPIPDSVPVSDTLPIPDSVRRPP
jgi:monofunctional glycosyltransferase